MSGERQTARREATNVDFMGPYWYSTHEDEGVTMITPSDLTAIIQQSLPDAKVHCEDLTGTQDHWKIQVISQAFEGKRLLEQHRMVKSVLHNKMLDNTIHALSLKTWTPERWEAQEASQAT